MMHLARKIEQGGSNRIHFALAFRHPDSNFDPDFFIARLHINIADKIQPLRQCSGSRLRVDYRCLAVAIRIEGHWGAQVRFPAAD